MPGFLGGDGEEQEPEEQGSKDTPLYRQSLKVLEECCKRWQSMWNPGSYITVDESLVKWTGGGEM